MKRALVFLILSACASEAPVFNPVEVEVPVPIPCTPRAVPKPDFALSHVGLSETLALKTKAALIELNQRRAYEVLLESQRPQCQ
ncbi:MAG: hypothetical protein WC521_02755 [Bdellovibrionales bacterium]|jgi:hypothetical protein